MEKLIILLRLFLFLALCIKLHSSYQLPVLSSARVLLSLQASSISTVASAAAQNEGGRTAYRSNPTSSLTTRVYVCIEENADSFFQLKPQREQVRWHDALQHVSDKLTWDGNREYSCEFTSYLIYIHSSFHPSIHPIIHPIIQSSNNP